MGGGVEVEKGRLVSEGHPHTDSQWARALKGEFQGCTGRGRGSRQKEHSQL